MLLRSFFAMLSLCCSAQAAEITAIPLEKPGEAAIIVEGDIQYQDREQFLTKIAPFSSGVVIFNSRGGSAFAGIDIGKAIRMRNFRTWVPSGSFCASACAVAWLGGTHRLMGKSALIGFHSFYRIEGGTAVETGSGNAIYGAYLSQLGLSDRAIMYLSDAAPSSMNWLTPAEAESFGIDLNVFDPKPGASTATAPPQAKPTTLESRSRDFVIALNVLVSGPSEQFLRVVAGLYADPVSYFGKELPRVEVVTQVTNFLTRWPIRSYTVRPDSIQIQCNQESSTCHVTGLVDFDAKSVARKQWSHGTATFEYLVSFRPNLRWPIIVSENGSVVNRRVEALETNSSTGPQNLGAAR